MLDLLKKVLWNLRYPWPRSAIEGRIRALRISLCPKERFAECIALHEQNEQHGVPTDSREHYLAALNDDGIITYLAEDGDRLVGTFGLQDRPDPSTLCLCYLLVSPDQHRSGVGTTLILTALALLPEDHQYQTLCIGALPTARNFYYRLGFKRVGEFRHCNLMLQFATLPITTDLSDSCRTWLSEAGAILPASPFGRS